LDGRIIRIRGISAADEAAWRDLAERAAEPNPFYEADCIIPAALHQTYGDRICLAVAEDGGRFYACVPVMATNRWKFPYPVITSQVRRMGYVGAPLVDPEAGSEAMAKVLGVVSEQRSILRSRIFLLDTTYADGPVSDYVREAARALDLPIRGYESWERGVLFRAPEPDYDRWRSSKSRYNLRRQRRQLSEELGAEVRLVDRTGDPVALKEYVELESQGYKGAQGVAMANVAGEPEYFLDMCNRFALAGRLHVLTLQAADQVLAMEIWARGGEGLFMFKISYDERYGRFGPGVLLQTEAMSYFHHHTDASWIDTCSSADNELLLRLYPGRRRIEMVSIVLSRSILDRAVVSGFVMARPLHHRLYRMTHAKQEEEQTQSRE